MEKEQKLLSLEKIQTIKRKNITKVICIIFIFSIVIMLIDLPNGYIKGHDTDFHFPAITAIAEKLSWNNLIVQEPLKYIGNNFGYGTRFFYPPLPHLTAAYITKMLTVFNINNVAIGMRITQWLTIFLSGVAFYFLGEKLFKSKKISVLLSLFYMTAPYHLAQIFIRDSFSEMFIPIAIPLIVLGLLHLTEKKYKSFLCCFVVRIYNWYLFTFGNDDFFYTYDISNLFYSVF